MQLTIKKEIEEFITLETPAYFKDNYRTFKITEDEILEVGREIVIVWQKTSGQYKTLLSELTKKELATDADFVNACHDMISILNQQVNNAKEMAWDEATR